MPTRATAYLAVVVISAVAAVTWGFATVGDWVNLGVLVLTYLALTLLQRAHGHGHLIATLGSIVALAAIPITGVAGAVLVGLLGEVIQWLRVPLRVAAFNVASPVLQILAAGAVFTLLTGGHSNDGQFSVTGDLIPLVIANATYLMVNALLVSLIIWYANGIPLRQTWSEMRATALPHLAYGLFGSLLYVLWQDAGLGPFAAIFLLLPLSVARWTYAQALEEQQAYDRTVAALIRAIETKDSYTRGHSERVSEAVELIAESRRMPSDKTAALKYAGLLHDLGKLGVPTRVLQKSERLTPEEFASIQLHPLRGLEMVRDIAFLHQALAGIMHHHERMDGRGYPMGLAGDEIPEFARAIAVADAFDSMTSTRSYRGARTVPDALAELVRCSGTQFDPAMVDALVAGVHRHGWQAPELTEEQAAMPPNQLPYDHDQIEDMA